MSYGELCVRFDDRWTMAPCTVVESVSVRYTPCMKPKDSGLPIELQRDLREAAHGD